MYHVNIKVASVTDWLTGLAFNHFVLISAVMGLCSWQFMGFPGGPVVFKVIQNPQL